MGLELMNGLNMSIRLRRTPYTNQVEKLGVSGFSIVNHMLLPKAFQSSLEEDYWHLKKHVQIWDVSCQRQVEIQGQDAQKLIQLMTPRNIGNISIGDCLYIPLIDENAGLINDPVLLKLSEDKYWLSIADSDVLLYAKGVAFGRKLDVKISEPDVYPLAVQGPKAEKLLSEIFGSHITNIKFFKFNWIDVNGSSQLIARSGYSRQGGFEIYLRGKSYANFLWNIIWERGQSYQIAPGCPNLIERIEGGLFSYGNEMTIANNPFEIGLEKFCDLDGSIEYIGKSKLQDIHNNGVQKIIRGFIFGETPCPTCSKPWPVYANGNAVGNITSAIWSPRLKANVAQGMVNKDYWDIGQRVKIKVQDGSEMIGTIKDFPL